MEIIGTAQIHTTNTGTLLTVAHHTFGFFAFFGDHTDVYDACVGADFCVAGGVSRTEDMGPAAVAGGFERATSSERGGGGGGERGGEGVVVMREGGRGGDVRERIVIWGVCVMYY